MDASLALRAGAVQGLLVAAVFATLVALPLPEGFFQSYGVLAGPTAWLVCALATTRILRLGTRIGATAAVAGALAAVLVGLLNHDFGTIVAVLAFGLAAGLTAGHRASATPAHR